MVPNVWTLGKAPPKRGQVYGSSACGRSGIGPSATGQFQARGSVPSARTLTTGVLSRSNRSGATDTQRATSWSFDGHASSSTRLVLSPTCLRTSGTRSAGVTTRTRVRTGMRSPTLGRCCWGKQHAMMKKAREYYDQLLAEQRERDRQDPALRASRGAWGQCLLWLSLIILVVSLLAAERKLRRERARASSKTGIAS